MSSQFVGKTALVTGGSKGIGAATSLLLAENGANVVINYSTDSSAADEIVKKIGDDRALAVKGDAGSISAIEHMISETVKRFGKIDILIPCAGLLLMRDLEHTTEEDFDTVMRLNKAAPHMPSGSHIVLISTSQCVQQVVTPPYPLYTASKGAIEQMTRVMSKELLTKGICVNAVAPGPTGTDMFYKGKTEQMLKFTAGFSPMGRIGRPEEIAEAIVWLSGGQSGWVSGQVLRANGGSV